MTVYGRVHPCNRFFRTICIKQPVFMQEKVIMFPLTDIFHDIFQKLSIFLTTLLSGSLFCILLQSPNSPKQNIRMFHLIDFVTHRFFINEVTNCFFRCFHHILKLVDFVNSKRQPRQSNKHIACTAFKPWITGKDIMFTFLLIVILVSRIFQTVIKTITRCTISHFRLKCLFQSPRGYF